MKTSTPSAWFPWLRLKLVSLDQAPRREENTYMLWIQRYTSTKNGLTITQSAPLETSKQLQKTFFSKPAKLTWKAERHSPFWKAILLKHSTQNQRFLWISQIWVACAQLTPDGTFSITSGFFHTTALKRPSKNKGVEKINGPVLGYQKVRS